MGETAEKQALQNLESAIYVGRRPGRQKMIENAFERFHAAYRSRDTRLSWWQRVKGWLGI